MHGMRAIQPAGAIVIVGRVRGFAIFSLIVGLALGHANPYNASDIVVQTFGRGPLIFIFGRARAGVCAFLLAPETGLRR